MSRSKRLRFFFSSLCDIKQTPKFNLDLTFAFKKIQIFLHDFTYIIVSSSLYSLIHFHLSLSFFSSVAVLVLLFLWLPTWVWMGVNCLGEAMYQWQHHWVKLMLLLQQPFCPQQGAGALKACSLFMIECQWAQVGVGLLQIATPAMSSWVFCTHFMCRRQHITAFLLISQLLHSFYSSFYIP